MTPPLYNAQEHGALDGTPGYNDFIITCRGETEGDACTINYVDGLPVDPDSGVVDTHAISTEYRAPSERVATRALSFSVNQGAQIFSLPEGGYVVRRSIFDTACSGDITLVRNYNLTPNQVRAIAAFSGSGYNNMWCFAPEDGQTYADGARRPYQTPWNLQSREGLLALKTAIESILAGNASTPSQRRALADLSPQDRASLRTVVTEIDQRIEQTQEQSLLNQPWYVLVGHACLFGLAFWGMAEMGNAIKAAIRNRFGGGGGDGSGGEPPAPPPPPPPVPSAPQSHFEALPDTTVRDVLIGITVVAAAASLVLLADDATVVGVADDPALVVTVPVTVVAGGLALFFGASMSDLESAAGDAVPDFI